MFDRVVWELSIMIRSADFALFSEGELIAGLSVYPDVLPGGREPHDWQHRFASIELGNQHHHEITLDQLRRALPAASRITWGQLATLDIFRSRVWLHGRGDGLVLSFSKANPSAPQSPDHRTLKQIERELFEVRNVVLAV